MDEHDPERFRVQAHVIDDRYESRCIYASMTSYALDELEERYSECMQSAPGPEDLEEKLLVSKVPLSQDEKEEIRGQRVAALEREVRAFNAHRRDALATPASYEPWRQAKWVMVVDEQPDHFRVCVEVVDEARECVLVYTSVEAFPVERVGKMGEALLARAPGPDVTEGPRMRASGHRRLSPQERKTLPLPPRSFVEKLERADRASKRAQRTRLGRAHREASFDDLGSGLGQAPRGHELVGLLSQPPQDPRWA